MHSPVVSHNKEILEISVKAIVLGIFLSIVLAAANAYIGLLVGLTVSASIPAAALSMGLLRLFRNSTILENNMVQTAASAGESLAAGIIFTIPALVMMKAWSGYDYGPMVVIAILGGILGIAFTVPLRRALIIDAQLAFPEGQATAEVLKTGGIERTNKSFIAQKTDRSFKLLIQATFIGAVFKFFESAVGLLLGNLATTKALLNGKYLLLGNVSVSPALISVGYIVGLNIAILVFLGGIIGTVIGVPLNWAINSESIMISTGINSSIALADLSQDQWVAIANQSWQECRRIGVGAMMVGGIWTLFSLKEPLVNGIKSSISAYRVSQNNKTNTLRTDYDTPIKYVFAIILISSVPLFFVFSYVLNAHPDKILISALMTIMMLVLGFIFSSVAGYMAGIVGSSNNPVSGVTIATVVVSSLILLKLLSNFEMATTLGPIAVMYLAGLICSSAAIAGDNMQDLKCGYILGATPWRQQLFQVIGVISAAIVIPIILQLLDDQYGIGRPSLNQNAISSNFLAAPQASLMMSLTEGIFGSGINWNFIFLGSILAIFFILLDKIQEKRKSNFRFPVLAIAIGIYLPFGLSIPIFIGGLLAWLVKKKTSYLKNEDQQKYRNAGLLISSGLITGEALMGVVIALMAGLGVTIPFITNFSFSGTLALIVVTIIIFYHYRSSVPSNKF